MIDQQASSEPDVLDTGRRQGIALCLSGGGFRASLFHLGAMRRLFELGILQQLRWLSSVSGGSILAGHLATCMFQRGLRTSLAFDDWSRDVVQPFRRFASRDLRTVPFLAHLAWNWLLPQLRVRHLERRYRARLTRLTVGQLPELPTFVLCATDLTFGVNWVFSRERVGDYQAGYIADGGRWPLARAVAASACFPPIFGPMRVAARAGAFEGGQYRSVDRERLLDSVSLSDGGVYDNMGLEPVWERAQHVLVSDCGAPFDFDVGGTPIRRLLRYTSVVTSQTRALRLRKMLGDWNASPECRTYDGAYWQIGTNRRGSAADDAPGYSAQLVRDVIARVRTDLDAFTEAEMSVLENHGYFRAECAVRYLMPQLATACPEPRAPYADWMDEDRVRRALRNSHRRVSFERWVQTTFRE